MTSVSGTAWSLFAFTQADEDRKTRHRRVDVRKDHAMSTPTPTTAIFGGRQRGYGAVAWCPPDGYVPWLRDPKSSS